MSREKSEIFGGVLSQILASEMKAIATDETRIEHRTKSRSDPCFIPGLFWITLRSHFLRFSSKTADPAGLPSS